MTGSRPVSLSAVLLLTAASLACKPTSTASPAAAVAPTANIAASTPESPPTARTQPWAIPFIARTSACSPGDSGSARCTDEQPPVCGQKSDLTRATFTDSCAACSDPRVLYYSPGNCRDESPA